MGAILYLGFGALFHWIFWGSQFFGLASVAFIILWPFFVFWYLLFWILVIGGPIVGALIIWDVLSKGGRY